MKLKTLISNCLLAQPEKILYDKSKKRAPTQHPPTEPSSTPEKLYALPLMQIEKIGLVIRVMIHFLTTLI